MGSKPIDISASRGAAILGLSKWKTSIDVWLDIMEDKQPGFCNTLGYRKPENLDNAAMRWGTAFEDSIIMLSCESISSREKFATHKKYFITCHLDGIYPNSKILHEGKTTSQFNFKNNFGEPGTDKIPIEYQVQCQHQLLCTGFEKVILSVLVFPKRVEQFEEIGWEIDQNNIVRILIDYVESKIIKPIEWAETLNQMGYFHQYEIYANKEIQQKMIEKYSEWWENHVIKKQPPEIQNMDDIKKLFREPVGTVIATEQIERWHHEEKQINDELKLLNKRKDQLKTLQFEYLLECSDKKKYVIDDDSQEKIILRDIAGKKLHQYSKNKKGELVFK